MPVRPCFTSALALFIIWNTLHSCFALPMGEKEIAHVERETVKIAKEVFRLSGEETSQGLLIRLNQQNIRHFRVQQASVLLDGIKKDQLQALLNDGFDFDSLRKIPGIRVEATMIKQDIQALINHELSRQKPENLIISQIAVDFLPGKVHVKGLIDLRKIPGNILGFLQTSLSPFDAELTVQMDGSRLTIDILEAQVNGQPMTPELKTTILQWLNPLWDFSQLPYQATIEDLVFSPQGFFLKGWVFSSK